MWEKIVAHRTAMVASGEFEKRRRQQQVKWMWTILEDRLHARLRSDPAIRAKVKQTETAVANGEMTPTVAAETVAGLLEQR